MDKTADYLLDANVWDGTAFWSTASGMPVISKGNATANVVANVVAAPTPPPATPTPPRHRCRALRRSRPLTAGRASAGSAAALVLVVAGGAAAYWWYSQRKAKAA